MNRETFGFAMLAAALLRPLGLAAAAWLLLRMLRIRHPASRHAVWTAVLIGMLLVPVVSVMTPHWKLPVLPRKHESAIQEYALANGPAVSAQFDSAAQQPGRPPAVEAPTFGALAVWCYLAGLLILLTYRAMGRVLLWRVVARSRPLRARRLRESADVLAPVAVGVLRPVVILPAGWRTWNVGTRKAVMAHEFAHLRRLDPLVSALGRLATCLLWFHPLAWFSGSRVVAAQS